MGKTDIRTREYVRDNSVFADICNYMLFDGEQVIKPEELVEKDPGELVMPFRDGDISIPVQKFRDVIKMVEVKTSDKATFVVMGVENQAKINYAMVIRNMLYDAISYSSQVNEIGNENRKMKKVKKSAEFLSGIRKDDKIKPVITIVVYWGTKKWDGARFLHEMLDVEDEFKRFIPNYYINLITPNEIEDFTKFHTELGLVLESIKYMGNKKAFFEMLEKKRDRFTNVEKNTAELISEITNVKLTYEQKEGSGKIDMCKAIEEMMNDVREEVREELK
ncbi:MAG: Rpn family recombination-promoting nuclease/putative transposase, partial [Eubacteriales bacterium]|nr:Rpn family recombination-promoting nuclease/putative transposase [Eubacteriales bacterium]